MLNKIRKNVTIQSESMIDEQNVAGFSATIDSETPTQMSVSFWVNNNDLYKSNITQCRKDEAEFRKLAQKLQDELLAENP